MEYIQKEVKLLALPPYKEPTYLDLIGYEDISINTKNLNLFFCDITREILEQDMF